MATHSSIFVQRIPWTEEPSGLQSTGSQRVRHDLATKQQGASKPFKDVWRRELNLLGVGRHCSLVVAELGLHELVSAWSPVSPFLRVGQSLCKPPAESLPGFSVLAHLLPSCEKLFYVSATCPTCCGKAARWGDLAAWPGAGAHSFLALAHASRNRGSAKRAPMAVPSSSTRTEAWGCLNLPGCR